MKSLGLRYVGMSEESIHRNDTADTQSRLKTLGCGYPELIMVLIAKSACMGHENAFTVASVV